MTHACPTVYSRAASSGFVPTGASTGATAWSTSIVHSLASAAMAPIAVTTGAAMAAARGPG